MRFYGTNLQDWYSIQLQNQPPSVHGPPADTRHNISTILQGLGRWLTRDRVLQTNSRPHSATTTTTTTSNTDNGRNAEHEGTLHVSFLPAASMPPSAEVIKEDGPLCPSHRLTLFFDQFCAAHGVPVPGAITAETDVPHRRGPLVDAKCDRPQAPGGYAREHLKRL